jgi:hypothetical protein
LIELTEEQAGRYSWFDESEFEWLTLDVTDQALPWLLGEVDERKPDDAEWTPEAAEEKQIEFDDHTEALVISDAPGQITAELHTVIDPADTLITLANDDSEEKFDEWDDVAQTHDIDVLIEFTTILEQHADPDYSTSYEGEDVKWDFADGEGLLKDLSREAFEAGRTQSLHPETKQAIKKTSQKLLELGAEDLSN